jgi:hypothetical protein
MSGYSGKPLVQKLGIKPGFCIFAAGAPTGYRDMVGKLPAQVTIVTRLTDSVDLIHLFATKAAEVRKFDDFSICGSGSSACTSLNAMSRPAVR